MKMFFILLKIIVIFLFFIFLASCSDNSSKKNERGNYNEEFDFIGSVDSFSYSVYSVYSPDSIVSTLDDLVFYYKIRFNEMGLKTSKSSIENIFETQFYYNENWALIQEYEMNKNKELNNLIEYEYYEDGKLKYKKETPSYSEYIQEYYYEYDEKGNLILETYKSKGRIIDITKYEYVYENKLLKEINKFETYDLFDKKYVKKFKSKIIFEYPDDYSKTETKYLNNGDIDFMKEYYRDTLKSVTYYDIKYSRAHREDIDDRFDYPMKIKFKYNTDSLGNWTIKVININNKPAKLILREFYYN